MTQETEKPDAPDQSAQQSQKTAREIYLRMIAHNPKWRDTTAGRSLIIGGMRPPKNSAD